MAKHQGVINEFQFTHPGRGATEESDEFVTTYMFQFTHPGRGATVEIKLMQANAEFQFTHPGRGATRALISSYATVIAVSIHAPREGCDGASRSICPLSMRFQFTHPGRGATSTNVS